ELAERAVDHLERRLAVLDVVERDVLRLALLVGPHRVALRERPAARILARQTHRMAFAEQRAEGERLGRRPVESLARLERLALVVEDALERAVDIEIAGNAGQRRAHFLQAFHGYVGVSAAVLARGDLEPGPAAFQPVGLVRLVA